MAAKTKRARSRAAKQGALVRKVRAGERGALAELLRRFPERGREIRAERRAEAKPKGTKRKSTEPRVAAPTKRKPAKPKKTASPKKKETRELAKARRRAEAAEKKAREEKERADRLEREFQEALRKDREAKAKERAEKLARKKAAEEPRVHKSGVSVARREEHAPWEGPPKVNKRSLLDRFLRTRYTGRFVTGVRAKKTRKGFVVRGWVHLPGERPVRVRGYEIVVRDFGGHERRFTFWGDASTLDTFSAKQAFEEDISPEDEIGVGRAADEDFIMHWQEAS